MPSMSTWVTDVREFARAHEANEAAVAPSPGAIVREIVEATTSRRVEDAWCSAVRCIAVVRGKACGARIHVRRATRGRIDWSCVACGEAGVITGFEGTAFDLSRYVPRRRKLRVWGFDDESRGVLLTAATWIPSLRAVVARARPVDTVPGLLIVEATVAELDQMYTLVEDLSDVTRGRRKLERLDGLRASLSTSIDGF
jgi:hypothetical protein